MKRRFVKGMALLAIALIFCLTSVAMAFSPDDASGFVLLSEAVPEAILEIRYYSTFNFIGERIDGYEEPVALLTREAATALREVSEELGEMGYRLKIYDAYRPQMAVDHFVRWAGDTSDTRMKAYFYPDLDKSVLFKQGYIAGKSGHSRGSTVDLTLFDMRTGREVDMGGTFDYFGERSHPNSAAVTGEQRSNRMLLRDVMVAHGFKTISTEWWHFTLVNEPYPNTYFTFPVNSASVGETSRVWVKKGMKGIEVQYYQELLIKAGFLAGNADGIFGSQTEAAVIAFQERCGFEPTGIIADAEAEMLSAIGVE